MLKTLRITSLIAMVVAAFGVIVILIFGLRGNPEIKALLESRGIIETIKDKIDAEGKKEDAMSPLVAQAKKFALRIDPPPPPPPPKPKGPIKPPTEVARAKPTESAIPRPKVQTSDKFDLLATVVYEEVPEKSLALLKTGSKQEWFRQGEMAGRLQIDEIRDGSVVFTQDGMNPQERFVPVETAPKSLLKSDQKTPMSPPAGPTGSLAPLPDAGPEETIQTNQAVPTQKTDTQLSPMVRPIDRGSRPQADAPTRIQRIRSIPSPPPADEQKASLDQTMSRIEAIMSRQDISVSEEQQQKEKQMWNRLLNELNTEKQRIEKEQPPGDSTEQGDQKDGTESSEQKTDQKQPDKDKSASAEPNVP
jgi:hypothetical protein